MVLGMHPASLYPRRSQVAPMWCDAWTGASCGRADRASQRIRLVYASGLQIAMFPPRRLRAPLALPPDDSCQSCGFWRGSHIWPV